MCGFGGIINSSTELNINLITQIAKNVAFRGPDYTGITVLNQYLENSETGYFGFFHNRLSIIDIESRSNQPYEDADSLLLFNGEIYNFQEIKKELIVKGYSFSTTSDTEVLFMGLKDKGAEILKDLNGMFSFLYLNKKNGNFIGARDRVGIKPFYYKISGNQFSFASELKTVYSFDKKDSTIDYNAINYYLALQCIPTPKSALKNIYKLPPGNIITGNIYEAGLAITIRPYWDAYSINSTINKFDEDELISILNNAIKSQMVSDVPVGFFLSSGVDSSLLAAVACNSEYNSSPLNFFTVAFEQNTQSDESKLASTFISNFKSSSLNHYVLPLNQNRIIYSLETIYNYLDEPFGDPTVLLNKLISEEARKHVKVVLSGDGADELFWGYPRYNQWDKQINENSYMTKKAASLFKSTLLKILPESRLKYTLNRKLETDPYALHFNLLKLKMFGWVKDITIHDDLWCNKSIENIIKSDALIQYLDLKTYLADAMLYKVDRSSMAVALEVRVPYLDNAIIDYALRLSKSEKKHSGHFKTKAPLKKALNKIAPFYDISSPKKGFNFPIQQWLFNEWRDMVNDLITKNNVEEFGIYYKNILPLLKDPKCYFEVWYILNLILWKKSIFNK